MCASKMGVEETERERKAAGQLIDMYGPVVPLDEAYKGAETVAQQSSWRHEADHQCSSPWMSEQTQNLI